MPHPPLLPAVSAMQTLSMSALGLQQEQVVHLVSCSTGALWAVCACINVCVCVCVCVGEWYKQYLLCPTISVL